MTIRDHTERLELAVTALDSSAVFLGHKWLQRHNPDINWASGTVTFTQCLASCGYVPKLEGIDKETEDLDSPDRLEPDDRIFYFDWDGYVQAHASTQKKIEIHHAAIQEQPDFV